MAATPADRWKAKVAGFRRQCQAILGVSPNIRYAGVINEYGRTLAGIIRPGTRPLIRPDAIKNEFFVVSTLMSMRDGLAPSVGALEHVVLRHKKVTIVLLRKRGITYYVSVGRAERDVEGLAGAIKKAV